MNNLDRFFLESSAPGDFSRRYLDYLAQVLAKLELSKVSVFIDTLLQARERESQIFFLGNGGSAATASHFANDLTLGTRSRGKPFKAVSLCDNNAILTAIGNDFGYDQVFVRQLRSFLNENDVVVAISASGNSPNVLRAVEYAIDHGGITVGLTGFDGGRLRQLVQVSVHIETQPGEYGPVEDAHMILDHLIGAYLMQVCAQEKH